MYACDFMIVACIVLSLVAFFLLFIANNIYIRCACVVVLLLMGFSASFYIGLALIAIYTTIVTKTAHSYRKWTDLYTKSYFPLSVSRYDRGTHQNKSVIFIINHNYQGHFDIFTLASLGLPENLRIVHIPLAWPVSSVLKMWNGIQIETKNGGAFTSFMTQCKEALHNGDCILVFPEGGTPRTFQTRHTIPGYRSGTFQLAVETQCPIVPIVCLSDPNFFGVLYPNRYEITFLPALYPYKFQNANEMRDFVWKQMNDYVQKHRK